MDYKYKVGDKVRIRRDLGCQESYKMVSGPKPGYDPGISFNMCKYAGKITTILNRDITYEVEGCDNWTWSDEMLEPVNQFCCKSLL